MNIPVLLKEAYQFARLSPDFSNQNGAVVTDEFGNIIGTGCNHFPLGVKPVLTPREEKYKRIQHAERAALYDSCKGHNGDRKYLVSPWACCHECAKTIIGMGIEVVYVHKERMDMTPDRWKESIKSAHEMLRECGIGIIYWSGRFGDESLQVYVNGELWIP